MDGARDGKNYLKKAVFKEGVWHRKIVFRHVNPNFVATIEFEPQYYGTLPSWRMVFETKELLETLVKTFRADEGLKQNAEKLSAYLQCFGGE